MAKPERVALILLAAGTSSRFKSEKLTAFFEGKRLLQWALDSFSLLELEKILVIKPGFPLGLFSPDGCRVVVNYDYETGIASSIKAGLKKLQEASSEELHIQYIGAPRYRLVMSAPDYKTAEEALKEVTNLVVADIKDTGGDGAFHRDAK